MTDTITLPRAVGEHLFSLLLDRIHGPYEVINEDETAIAALDAALAEPKKERAETGIPARSGVGAGQTNAPTGEAYRTPEPDAKREPATREQIAEAYIKPDVDGRWRDFEVGFRAAERHHGITKEDGK